MKKLTKEEFIEKAKCIHGDRYDYSKVDYINNRTKVCVICKKHGEFWQQANSHLRGEGCPICKGENISKKKSLTKEEFIKKARKVHGNKYDYSKVEYKNSSSKVCIICPQHGEFWQTANTHLQGSGCPSCAFKLLSNVHTGKNKSGGYPKLTKEEFIEKAKRIHGNKYDYSKVEYVNNKTKVCIICPIHGEFWQKPNAHLSGFGCYKCGREAMSLKQTKNTELFIEEAKKIHSDKYDYSKVKYTTGDKKVCIICPQHGEFWQTPYSHLQGQGCPICNESHLERDIRTLLNENSINFIQRATKEDIPWIGRQHLDFYLPEHNIAIECQGRQHFESDKFFGSDKGFYEQVKRDYKKLKKCIEHRVKVLYYTDPSFKALYDVITNKEEIIQLIKNENTA